MVWKQTLVLIYIVLFCIGCHTNEPPIVERNEALSSAVYATGDALNVSRIDVAIAYAKESMRLVEPPSVRKIIKPIPNKKGQTTIVLPEELKDKPVLVVNSEEYNELLKTQEISVQIKKENEEYKQQIKTTDKELRRQIELKIYLGKKVQELTKEVSEKEGEIDARNKLIMYLFLALGTLIALVVAYVALKIKGLLPSFLLF